MTDRLTKFNAETGEYEYKERAKTQAEYNEQRKAVIQRLGEFEDRAEGRWKGAGMGDYYCSLCCSQYSGADEYNYCPNCGAKMKGENDE